MGQRQTGVISFNLKSGQHFLHANGANLTTKRTGKNHSTWKFEYENGYAFIKNQETNKYLNAPSPNEMKLTANKPVSARWKMERSSEITQLKNLKHSKYLSIKNGAVKLVNNPDPVGWETPNSRPNQGTGSGPNPKNATVGLKHQDAFPARSRLTIRVTSGENPPQNFGTITYPEYKEIEVPLGSLVEFEVTNAQPGVISSYQACHAIENFMTYDIVFVDNVYDNHTDLPVRGNLSGYKLNEFDPILNEDTGNHPELFFDRISNSNTAFRGLQHHDMFTVEEADKGFFGLQQKVYASEYDYSRSFSFRANNSLTVSAGVDGAGIGGSVAMEGGFTRLNEISMHKNYLYKVVTSRVEKYKVTLNKGTQSVALNAAFVGAVNQLLLPQKTAINGAAAARKDPAFQDYLAFINKWGTHICDEADYGGRFLKVTQADSEYVMDKRSRSWNFGADASVSGGPITVGGGFGINSSTSTSTQEASENIKSDQKWLGGSTETPAIDPAETWTVANQNAQPVVMRFCKLSELLHPQHLVGIPGNHIAKKAAMLSATIDAYMEDYGSSFADRPSSSSYCIFVDKVVVKKIKESGTSAKKALYGVITLGAAANNGEDYIPQVDVWRKSRDNRQKNMTENTQLMLDGGNSPSQSFRVHVVEGANQNVHLGIGYAIKEYDSKDDDLVANTVNYVRCSWINNTAPERKTPIVINNAHAHIEIHYVAWKEDIDFSSI